jgi:hypothetical protein
VWIGGALIHNAAGGHVTGPDRQQADPHESP